MDVSEWQGAEFILDFILTNKKHSNLSESFLEQLGDDISIKDFSEHLQKKFFNRALLNVLTQSRDTTDNTTIRVTKGDIPTILIECNQFLEELEELSTYRGKGLSKKVTQALIEHNITEENFARFETSKISKDLISLVQEIVDFHNEMVEEIDGESALETFVSTSPGLKKSKKRPIEDERESSRSITENDEIHENNNELEVTSIVINTIEESELTKKSPPKDPEQIVTEMDQPEETTKQEFDLDDNLVPHHEVPEINVVPPFEELNSVPEIVEDESKMEMDLDEDLVPTSTEESHSEPKMVEEIGMEEKNLDVDLEDDFAPAPFVELHIEPKILDGNDSEYKPESKLDVDIEENDVISVTPFDDSELNSMVKEEKPLEVERDDEVIIPQFFNSDEESEEIEILPPKSPIKEGRKEQTDESMNDSTTYSVEPSIYELKRRQNIMNNKKFLMELNNPQFKKESKTDVKPAPFRSMNQPTTAKKEVKTSQRTREPKKRKRRKTFSDDEDEDDDDFQPQELIVKPTVPKPKEGIFGGLNIFFFVGADMRQKRCDILKEKVTENGSQKYCFIFDTGGIVAGRFTLSTTHIISGASYSTLESELNSSLRGVRIHTPDWISEALKKKQRLSENEYVLPFQPSDDDHDTPTESPKLEPLPKPIQEKPEKKKIKFACENIEDENFNHNEELTNALQKLENIYLLTGDVWRSLAYRKSIKVLKAQKMKITSISQLPKQGIGEKTLEKIQEYLTYGIINRLDKLESNESVKVVSLFSSIFGVGPKTAMKWYHSGHKTIEDLKKNCDLTHQQKIGIKYFTDLQERIPREEVEEIEKLVINVGHKINPNLVITISGSYRRGAKTCGDVDVLVMDPSGDEELLSRYVEELTKMNFLTDNLTSSFDKSNSYMGICKLKELHRRIDIKIYPSDQYAFALLYFTGSNYFNRSMRFAADRKGYILGDKSLKKVIRVSKEKVHESDSIACSTEKEIFEALGMEYKAPHERNI